MKKNNDEVIYTPRRKSETFLTAATIVTGVLSLCMSFVSAYISLDTFFYGTASSYVMQNGEVTMMQTAGDESVEGFIADPLTMGVFICLVGVVLALACMLMSTILNNLNANVTTEKNPVAKIGMGFGVATIIYFIILLMLVSSPSALEITENSFGIYLFKYCPVVLFAALLITITVMLLKKMKEKKEQDA